MVVISNCRERRQRQGKLKVIGERKKLHRKREREIEKERAQHKQHNICPCPGERKKYKHIFKDGQIDRERERETKVV